MALDKSRLADNIEDAITDIDPAEPDFHRQIAEAIADTVIDEFKDHGDVTVASGIPVQVGAATGATTAPGTGGIS
jgi:hypothetical protein